MIELTPQHLHLHKLNDRKSIVQNFKLVVQSQVELHDCKVEIKLDESIRPLFTNPVTNTICFEQIIDISLFIKFYQQT